MIRKRVITWDNERTALTVERNGKIWYKYDAEWEDDKNRSIEKRRAYNELWATFRRAISV